MSYFQNLPVDHDAPKYKYFEGILNLFGKCIPDDSEISLTPIFEEAYKIVKDGLSLTISMKFEYINTKSSKKFLDLFLRLNEFRKKDFELKSKREIFILWHSPKVDEDIIELGEFYQEFSDGLAKKGKYPKIKFILKTYNYE